MGMALGRFEMLKQLRTRENRNWMEEHYKFVLTGVIVHDVNDQPLRNLIRKNIDRWAEMTGERFLFLTFIAPRAKSQVSKFTKEYFSFNKGFLSADATLDTEDETKILPLVRMMYRLPEQGSYILLSENLYSNHFSKIPISTDNIEYALGQITEYCEQENHDPSDFDRLKDELCTDAKCNEQSADSPIIEMLVDSLSLVFKSEYKKTLEEIVRIGTDLMRGEQFSEDSYDFSDQLDSFINLLYRIERDPRARNIRSENREFRHSIQWIGRSRNSRHGDFELTYEIEQFVQFAQEELDYIEFEHTDHYVETAQTEHVREVLNRLKKKIIENGEGGDLEQRIFEIEEYIVGQHLKGVEIYSQPDNILSEAVPTETRHLGAQNLGFQIDIPNIRQTDICNSDKLEKDSVQLYNSYLLLKNMVLACRQETDSELSFFDYSGLTIYLGKIVENEFYKSVGQMLRWTLFIDMPRFYAKYCKKFGNITVNRACLNSYNMGPDYRIPMGDLLYAYKDISIWCANYAPNIDINKFIPVSDKLCEFIEDFAQNYRNRPAHADANSKNTFEEAEVAFKRFAKHYLIELYEIRKQVLSGKIEYTG